MKTQTGQTFRLEDYAPTDFRILRVDLSFRLDGTATRVRALLEIERREGADVAAPLVLDAEKLSVESVTIDGKKPGSMALTPETLTLGGLPATGPFRVETVTLLDPAANTQLSGLYLTNGVYCTQCEAQGFRRITPFYDRPDVLAVFSVRIEARKAVAPLLLSNGNPGKSGALDGGWHFAEWHDPFPKPSYLFALVAGDLETVSDAFVTASGKDVRLAIHVEHGKGKRAVYAMDALKRSMRWDEEVFGREYDLSVFNIVAVSDFNMGAMENKGLNVFNDKYVLADAETATDADFAAIEAIIAHEYFHNWTGNRITCRDWFQLCLKEGLTVYRDHEFSADQRSRPVKRIAEVRALKAHQFPEDQGPLAHPVRPRRYQEINNFYTSTVYEKGSEVVRMIRTLLGPQAFRAGMDIYFDRHDGQAVTIEDFLKAFEDASGRDLGQFALWYHQAGTPNLSIAARHDPRKKVLTLEVEQSMRATPGESRKKLMHIPLAFGLVGPDGADMAWTSVDGAQVEGGVLHVRKRKHVVRFTGIEKRPALSLNRGFSAPVTLAAQTSPEDRAFLARHDSDPFSRWQALNSLLTDALTAAARRKRGAKPAKGEASLIRLCAAVAGDEALEPAYRALALSFPGEADIARELGENIDPDAIFGARNELMAHVSLPNVNEFAAIAERHRPLGAFDPGAAQAGKRALTNLMTEFLCIAESSPQRAAAAFKAAGNMTDKLAALTILAHRFGGGETSADALAAFEKMHGDDPLIMDKWFLIQASSPGPSSLDAVKRLMGHKGFSLGNPNRVRSLIGTFAAGNQTGFNRADGAGYDFFAETVLEIDARNPQLAARLATSFRSWRILEPVRRERARLALVAITTAPKLSADLAEIAGKTLG